MAAGDGLTEGALVLTLEMDGESFGRFNEMRRASSAPGDVVPPAHVTLFRSLPADRARDIRLHLREIAAREKPLHAQVGEVKPLERGVAVFLRSPRLMSLREGLAREWGPWLAPADRTGFRPHVTIRNNIAASEAREVERRLRAAFRPFRLLGLGLRLWRHREGPWEDLQLFRFR